jgi:CRISPR-associated protein Csm3
MNGSNSARLIKKLIFSGKIGTLTGLHIGGSETGLRIGGADKVVVRNPSDNRPYLPGSSFKGKMRSLLERVHCVNNVTCLGFPDSRGIYGPCRCGECDVCRVFGIAADQNRKDVQAGRLLVRDALLTNHESVNAMPNLATDYTELKTEVSIDRLTSAANPRNFERVPAGAEFGFELVLNLFDGDAEEKFVELIEEGLRLVAYDALGGQSSRGYGRVRIQLDRRVELATAAFQSEDALKAALQINAMDQPRVWPVEESVREAAAA